MAGVRVDAPWWGSLALALAGLAACGAGDEPGSGDRSVGGGEAGRAGGAGPGDRVEGAGGDDLKDRVEGAGGDDLKDRVEGAGEDDLKDRSEREAAARAGLAAMVVEAGALQRRVLYTWTDAGQLAGLRKREVLLQRTRAKGGELSRFDAALGEGPVAQLLRRPGYAARRFAWPVAWATAMGLDDERYGDVLVAVELRAEAVLGRYEGGVWSFVDGAGGAIEEAALLAAPERLAAVMHVHAGGPDALAYRELVLVREAMIERWSIGTPAIAAELRAEADAIEAASEGLARAARTGGVPERRSMGLEVAMQGAGGGTLAVAAGPVDAAQRAWGESLRALWGRERGAQADLVELYLRCLALPGRAYVPDAPRLRALVERLRVLATAQPAPLEQRPVR